MKITYHEFESPLQQAIAEQAVLRHFDLLPHWLKRLVIVGKIESSGRGFYAEACCHNENVWECSLLIYPEFFSQPEWQQRSIIIHEFVHIAHAPIISFFSDASQFWPEEVRPALSADFKRRLEQYTESVTYIYERLEDTPNA